MNLCYKFSSLFQYKFEWGVLVLYAWDKTYTIRCSAKDKKNLIHTFNSLLGSIFSEEIFESLLAWISGKTIDFFHFFVQVGIIIDLNNWVFHDIVGWAGMWYNPSILMPLRKIEQEEHLDLVRDAQSRWDQHIIQWQKGVVYDLLARRRTIRRYAHYETNNWELEYLFACLYWNTRKETYQNRFIIHKTTPSGWAFWPLRIFFFRFVNKKEVFLEEYDGIRLISLKSLGDKETLCEQVIIYNESLDLENAQGLVVILADLENMSKKYGAKSYPLALLEWGHISQNFVLASEEKGYGTCELWWVIESFIIDKCWVNKETHIFVNAILFWKNSEYETINSTQKY